MPPVLCLAVLAAATTGWSEPVPAAHQPPAASCPGPPGPVAGSGAPGLPRIQRQPTRGHPGCSKSQRVCVRI